MHFWLVFFSFYYQNNTFPKGFLISNRQNFPPVASQPPPIPPEHYRSPPRTGGESCDFQIATVPPESPLKFENPPGTGGNHRGEFLPPEGFGVRGEFPPMMENPPRTGGG